MWALRVRLLRLDARAELLVEESYQSFKGGAST
jgi:hypothetical protein